VGDPKKIKKKYLRPRKPWDKKRLDEERILKETYGLKNKKELWVTEKMLKNKRQNARKLLALELEKRIQREKELMNSLKTIGLLKENATMDDTLGLKIEEFLERRLQTVVWRKGLANTAKQARQFIVHGHIAINGKKVNIPSYLVKADEENKITFYKKELILKPETKKKEATKKAFEEFEEIIEENTEEEKDTKKDKKEVKKEKAKDDKNEDKEKKEKNEDKKETKKEDTTKETKEIKTKEEKDDKKENKKEEKKEEVKENTKKEPVKEKEEKGDKK